MELRAMLARSDLRQGAAIRFLYEEEPWAAPRRRERCREMRRVWIAGPPHPSRSLPPPTRERREARRIGLHAGVESWPGSFPRPPGLGKNGETPRIPPLTPSGALV
jgi:hypothetical protein